MTSPTDHLGRFISRDCPDDNCGGRLQWDRDHWRCDGLVGQPDPMHSPLHPCPRTHSNGDQL